MTPNSSYEVITIDVGVDYTPEYTHDDVGSVSVISGKESPIYGIMPTEVQSSPVELQLIGMDSTITIPTDTFKRGVIYYFYLKKVIDDGGSNFVGLKYANHPLVY